MAHDQDAENRYDQEIARVPDCCSYLGFIFRAQVFDRPPNQEYSESEKKNILQYGPESFFHAARKYNAKAEPQNLKLRRL